MLTKIEVNCETGEQIIRELTAEEYAQAEKDAAEFAEREAKRKALEDAQAKVKASALAKLAALGLTEEEAAAIAG